MEKNVEMLIQLAVKAQTADAAMKFAQAALNAANAIGSLVNGKILQQQLKKES